MWFQKLKNNKNQIFDISITITNINKMVSWIVKRQTYDYSISIYNDFLEKLNHIMEVFNQTAKTPYSIFVPFPSTIQNEKEKEVYLQKKILEPIQTMVITMVKQGNSIYKKEKIQIYATMYTKNLKADIQNTQYRLDMAHLIYEISIFFQKFILCSSNADLNYKMVKNILKCLQKQITFLEDLQKGWSDFYDLQTSSSICDDVFQYILLPYLQ